MAVNVDKKKNTIIAGIEFAIDPSKVSREIINKIGGAIKQSQNVLQKQLASAIKLKVDGKDIKKFADAHRRATEEIAAYSIKTERIQARLSKGIKDKDLKDRLKEDLKEHNKKIKDLKAEQLVAETLLKKRVKATGISMVMMGEGFHKLSQSIEAGAEKLAGTIFDKIEMFAGYGFNKSHSACYGHISYWTAYLKANHPVEFMAALLSNEIHNTDKIGVFVSECHRMGLEILAPDLNASQLRFSPEVTPNGSKGVRYGLAAIKNCGEGAMAIAIEDRYKNGAFTSLDDFASRLDSKVVNKRILENLAKAGALDWTQETRAGMCARLEQVVASASSAQRDRASGQVSMFDSMDFAAPAKTKTKRSSEPAVEEWSKDERLAHEKELLGFYVTGHPLDKFRSVIDSNKYRRLGLIDDLDLSNPRERFPFAGMVRSLDAKMTKTGKPFGVLILEDFTGSCEIMLWGETFVPARDAGLLDPGKIIRLKGNIQVDDRTGGRRITGYELSELKPKRVAANHKGPLELMLWTTRHSERDLIEIKLALANHPGATPVLLHFQNSAGRRVTVAAGESFNIKRTEELEESLGRWLEE